MMVKKLQDRGLLLEHHSLAGKCLAATPRRPAERHRPSSANELHTMPKAAATSSVQGLRGPRISRAGRDGPRDRVHAIHGDPWRSFLAGFVPRSALRLALNAFIGEEPPCVFETGG